MRKIQTIALFLAVLVLSLPVVSAQQLNVIRVSGKEGISGYSKTRDDLEIEILANIPYDQNIGDDQVQLWVDDSFAFFDSCEKEAGTTTYRCKFEQPGFAAFTPLDFIFKLLDDDGQVVDEKKTKLRVDSVKPAIKQFKVSPSLTSGEVEVSYEIEDYGVTINDVTDCSGIQSVKITGDGELASETGQPGRCKLSNKITIDLDETTNVCIEVKDFVGYETFGDCKKVIVDKSPPEITLKEMTDTKGNPLTHYKGQVQGRFAVKINDESEVKNVKANFASISSQKSDKSPTTVIGDIYIWEVPVTGGTPCAFTVKATDKLGSEAEEQFTCNLRKDTTGPTLVGIKADNFKNNKPLYGKNTPLKIEFEDKDDTGAAGVGFYQKEAYIDLSQMGMSTLEKATYCAGEDGKWECSWTINPPESTPEGRYEVSVAQATADDFDNIVQNTTSYFIYYDNTPPQKPEVVDTAVVQGQSDIEGAVKGNYVRFTVESANYSKATADFSAIGGNEEQALVQCVDTPEGKYQCEFTQLISYSGPYLADIKFTFLDEAGNGASTTAQLEVFGIEGETNAKYWKHKLDCTPKLIDRATASIIPPYLSCRVHLEPVRQNIETLSIEGPEDPFQCIGDTETALNDVYLTNNQEGSTDPYLVMKLNSMDYYTSQVNISCPISIFTKRITQDGSYISPEAQVIDANTTIEFYNVPKQDLYNEVDRKIGRALDDGWRTADWLSDLREFLYYAEVLCQIKGLITSVLGILFSIAGVMGMSAEIMKSNPVTAGAGTTLERGYSVLCRTEEFVAELYGGESKTEIILQFLDSICAVANCAVASGGKGEWGLDNLTGGDVPWCSSIKELFSYFPFLGEANRGAGTPVLNIKDSLFWSSICLCLPGIVYNLEKLREIHCYKAVCYYDYVKEQGYPLNYCEGMHDYLVCQFVVGQIFASVPFSAFFENAVDLVVSVISDPLMAFTIALGWVCQQACDSSTSTFWYITCGIYKVTAAIGEAVGSVKHMSETKDYFSPPSGQYCDRAEEIEDIYEEMHQQTAPEEEEELPEGALM